jgi:hypothetical protein
LSLSTGRDPGTVPDTTGSAAVINVNVLAQCAAVTATIRFIDFGTPVSIAPPPVSTVATLGQFEQAAKAVQSPIA